MYKTPGCKWMIAASTLVWQVVATAPLAIAQEPPVQTALLLPVITVTATRVAQDANAVPATVTVIDAQQIDRGLVQSIQDLIRYEPGVSVNTDPNRFGASSFNIRGLDGNRVVIQVDGVRAPNLFTFGIGPFNTSTRNMVDLDAVKRVEILRGPASTLYGSDALGGVVSYVTKDPLDYLDLDRSNVYGAVKSSFASANDGWQSSATLAAGTQEVQGLLLYTYFTGRATQNFGDNTTVSPARTAPNPLDFDENNWLAKLVFGGGTNYKLKVIGERYDRDAAVDILSLNASTPTTSTLTGQDRITRDRGTIAYEWRNPEGGWFAGVTANIYQQKAVTNSDSTETRTQTSATCSGTTRGVNTCLIPREFDFAQTVTGANAQLESRLASENVAQRILWGGEVFETKTSALRNALRYNLTTGTVSNVIAGDTFPVHDFPNTTSLQAAAYVQDQISLLEDRLVVTPALRYDYYRLQVHPDSIYTSNTPPGVSASDFSDSAVSPKLSAIYSINPNLNGYGQYAFGFRAPPFDDVNAAFRNPVQSYVLIPNPDLQSETSQGLEIGLKGENPRGRFAVALFYNQYRDFIDQRAALDCPVDPHCVAGFAFTFQSINRARVRIYGAEAKGEWLLADRWTLAGSIAYANGEDTTLDVPLNTVNPLTGVAGIRYAAPGDQYGGSLNVTAVQRKTQAAQVGTATPFLTPGFTTVDLLGYWNIGRNAKIAAGVFNLLNKKYWLWSDVSSGAVVAGSPALDRYTQPGINASVSLQYAF